MSNPSDEKEKKPTITPTSLPTSPPSITTKPSPLASTSTTNKMAASIDQTNVSQVSADSLATRLEGQNHMVTPNTQEYAKYDQLREASVRIQMISERLAARHRSPPVSKAHRIPKTLPEKQLRTPEARAAAAAALAVGSSGAGICEPNLGTPPQQSRELTSYPAKSSEGSLEDSSITAQVRSALAQCGLKYLRPLGRGSYANVVLVDCDRDKKQMAVKVIEMDAHELVYIRKVILRELHVQSNVEPHENLMHVEKVFRYGRAFFFLMPFSSNGDLYEYIRKRNGYLNEKSACRLFYQLCSGVYHLHSQGYAHRDLKCENVLLTDNFDIKLTDFGFTCALKPVPKTPELIHLDAELSKSTKQPSVIWSLAAVRARKEKEKQHKKQVEKLSSSSSSSQPPSTKMKEHQEKTLDKGQEKSTAHGHPVVSTDSDKKNQEKKETRRGDQSQDTKLTPEVAKQPVASVSMTTSDTTTTTPTTTPSPSSTTSTTISTTPIEKQKHEDVYTVYRKCTLPPEERHRAEHTRILSEDNEVQFTQTYCGSLFYACPELLNRELYDPRAADVWSLGVILWVMLFNCYPYEDRRLAVRALAANTCVFELPNRPPVSDMCKNLIRKMLVKEDFRIRLSEVLECDWIQSNKAQFETVIHTVDSSGIESGRLKLGYRQFTGSFDL